MRSPRLTIVSLVALLVVAGAGVALSRVERPPAALPSALASMPPETLAASVTDWTAIRALVAGDDLPRPGVVIDRAYETDVSAVSVLGDRAAVMEDRYGWSVLDARWEGLAQSRQGAAIVVQLPPHFDTGVVRSGLDSLGYRRPFADDEVWRGGTDLVASIDSSLTPLMAHAAVLDESRRVVFSDRAEYAARTARVVSGDLGALGRSSAVHAVAEQLDGVVAGTVYAGRHGCRVMGFARASASDRATAESRVRAVGGIGAFSAVGLGLVTGDEGGLRRPPLLVAMHFDDDRAVEGEAARRRRLATGEAPGQGGTFGSRFSVESQQRGGDVVLRLEPRERDAQLLSDLNSGQLLFAGCG